MSRAPNFTILSPTLFTFNSNPKSLIITASASIIFLLLFTQPKNNICTIKNHEKEAQISSSKPLLITHDPSLHPLEKAILTKHRLPLNLPSMGVCGFVRTTSLNKGYKEKKKKMKALNSISFFLGLFCARESSLMEENASNEFERLSGGSVILRVALICNRLPRVAAWRSHLFLIQPSLDKSFKRGSLCWVLPLSSDLYAWLFPPLDARRLDLDCSLLPAFCLVFERPLFCRVFPPNPSYTVYRSQNKGDWRSRREGPAPTPLAPLRQSSPAWRRRQPLAAASDSSVLLFAGRCSLQGHKGDCEAEEKAPHCTPFRRWGLLSGVAATTTLGCCCWLLSPLRSPLQP